MIEINTASRYKTVATGLKNNIFDNDFCSQLQNALESFYFIFDGLRHVFTIYYKLMSHFLNIEGSPK